MSDDIKIIDTGSPDPGRCRHFTGTANRRCEAGVEYEAVAVRHEAAEYRHRRPNGRIEEAVYTAVVSTPCLARRNFAGATCEHYSPKTDEEQEAEEAEIERKAALMDRGLSSCCEAPIDRSRVIPSGRHKGHGPRYCLACGRCVLVV